jgi:hypothetical protein
LVLAFMIGVLALSACASLKKLITPLPPRRVWVDERPPRKEITHVYVYDFSEKLKKAKDPWLRSDAGRVFDEMAEGFKRGMYGHFMKRPVQIGIDNVRDLEHNGGSIDAYILGHLEAERSAHARYRLVLDPDFYYQEESRPQPSEGTVILLASLTRIADNKVVWEAVYRRWTSGYYNSGGYGAMAEEAAEKALADLFGETKP